MKSPGLDPAQVLAAAEHALRAGNAALARAMLEQLLAAQPRHSRANEYLAYVLGQSGDAAGAHRRLEAACEDPGCSAQALYYLGCSLLQRGEPGQAVPRFEQSLRKAGDFFEGLHELGTAQSRAGDIPAALATYRKAATLNPRSPVVHFNIGRMQDELGQPAASVQGYTRAIELQQDFAAAWSNRGIARSELGQHEEALADHERAVQLDPQDPDSWTARGVTLAHLQRWDEALASHERALQLHPEHPDAWTNKGVTLDALHSPEDALACHDRAVALAPQDAQAWSNRGRCLHNLQRYDQALAHFDRALALDPSRPGTWSDKGLTLAELHGHEEALACFDQALALRPDHAETLVNRALALSELGRKAEALAEFHRAWTLRPELDGLLGHLVGAQAILCDWTELPERLRELEAQIRAGRQAIAPFPALALFDDPAIGLQAARSWVRGKWREPPPPDAPPRSGEGGRIVLGYHSADFHEHATAYLMAEFFERHDRSRFELVAFSYGPDTDDASRRRLKPAFDHFLDMRGQTDAQVAERSRALGVDIGIDLKGFTRDNRFGVFARRAAPIQVSYLGYPGSTGASCMDYVLADACLVPEGDEAFYAEKVVRLPHSYQVNDMRRAPAQRVPTRAEQGLPGDAVVFCCFNNQYKILPATFDSWMRILQGVESGVLWLLAGEPAARENLRAEAARRGVDPDRLVFAAFVPQAEHLARYPLADLFLDTLPYNAHTTASDALRMGVPVLTLRGRAFAGRVACSLLQAVGLPELVTDAAAHYERLAIELALDAHRLQALRAQLARRRADAPLFDTARTTRAIEAAYLEMVRRQRAGLPPDHLAIAA